jgi:hypothetical protein
MDLRNQASMQGQFKDRSLGLIFNLSEFDEEIANLKVDA